VMSRRAKKRKCKYPNESKQQEGQTRIREQKSKPLLTVMQ